MEEKKLYHEIPGGKNKFHSAILTSFSFNFHHFEFQVLKALKNKYITNIGVLVDANMLDNSVGLTSSGLKQLTQSYSVNGISCKGAFHPKLNFIAGDDEALIFFGSGNISPGGHGKNHEAFTSLYADSIESPFLPLIQESWDYLQVLADDLQGFSKQRITSSIPKNCSLLGQSIAKKHHFCKVDKEYEIALVYNDESSILAQLSSLLPAASVEQISIVSPYYDEDGALLEIFLDVFPQATLDVYIPCKNGLPPVLIQPNVRITFYKWEDTKRGKVGIKGNESYHRKLHSKLFQFTTKEHNYFLIGSANATIPGFGTLDKRGSNEEFGAIYKTPKKDFFELLEITNSTKIKNLSGYKRTPDVAIEHNSTRSKKIKIVACDVIGSRVKLYLKNTLIKRGYTLKFFNDAGNEVFEKEFTILDDLAHCSVSHENLKLNPIYVQLYLNQAGAASNKQLINFTDKLYNTDPSKENRTIRGLIGALEMGKNNEIEILNYMNDLIDREEGAKNNKLRSHSNSDAKNELKAYPEMTYEEAMKASKNIELANQISQTYNAIQLWNALLLIFKDKAGLASNDLNDEEEDASATSSNKRSQSKTEKSTVIHTDEKNVHSTLKKVEKLKNDYIRSLNKINADKDLKINEVHLCQFLLVTHILTAILHFAEYQLAITDKSKSKECNEQTLKKTLENSYSTLMREILIPFSKFIISHDEELIKDNDLRELKMNDYKQKVLSHILIYHYLINQNKEDNPHAQLLNLVCLNIFDKLGLPDEESQNHIEQIAKTSTTPLFSYAHVLRLMKSLVILYINIDQSDCFFREQHRGVCYTLEIKPPKVFYKSVFDPEVRNQMDYKKFKQISKFT